MGFWFFFRKRKNKNKSRDTSPSDNSLDTLFTLKQSISNQDLREAHVKSKINDILLEAKKKMEGGDKRGALFAMKRKKMYDMEIDKIQNVKMTLETQVINLESAVLNKATVGAMSEGTKAMKSIRIKCGIEKVDEVIDAVREDGDFLTDMTSALSQSTYTVLVDDDELLAELNELTGADTAPTKYNAPAAKPLRGYGKVAPNASRLLVPAS